MAKADLYNISIASADTTTDTGTFIVAQRKITSKVKKDIKENLAKNGLSQDFSFAEKRVLNISRSFQAYATSAAIETIVQIAGVRDVERLASSMYPLTKTL